jgi:hypothetical protein
MLDDRRLPQAEPAPGLSEASGLRHGYKTGQQSGVEHGFGHHGS